MFGFFGLVFGAVKAVASVVTAVVKVVVAAVVTAVRAAIRQITMRIGSYDPMMDLWLNKQINWRRALTSQKNADDEVERLNEEMGDADGNGVPDLYDQQVTRPEDDYLHLKFPRDLLIEHDYVRFMPRALGAIPQPVVVGGKGLVTSVSMSSLGQFVWVKYNALNPPGRLDAPSYRCNSMDLSYIGHVFGSGQETRPGNLPSPL